MFASAWQSGKAKWCRVTNGAPRAVFKPVGWPTEPLRHPPPSKNQARAVGESDDLWMEPAVEGLMSGPMERRSAIAGHLLPLIYSQDRAVLRAVIAALRDAPSSRGASPETVGIAQLLVLKAGGLSRGAL